MIGLATKAGKTASGEFSTEKAVKERKSMPGDRIWRRASDNTTEEIYAICVLTIRCPCYSLWEQRMNLGAAMGKEFRASLAVT